jgi:2-hydroxychromene-2-carboxylate isomerase
MKHITFYLDFISPYAYLAFEQLPEALMGHSTSVTYKPVLFGALLKHHGQLGPAEIPGKREWAYRQVLWLAHQHGLELQLPATHPFNPLALLRLALAARNVTAFGSGLKGALLPSHSPRGHRSGAPGLPVAT